MSTSAKSGRNVRSRLLTLVLVAVTALWFVPTSVQAHGEFEKSRPRPNSVLTSAPGTVEVAISEPIDPVAGSIEVFASDGSRVDSDDVHTVDDNSLGVGLNPLDPGTYTVVWRVVSAVDGHTTTGSYRFTVSGGGRAFLGLGSTPIDESLEALPTLLNTVVRWAEIIGTVLVVGVVVSLVLVWIPASTIASSEWRAGIVRRLALVGAISASVAMAAILVELVRRALASKDVGSSLATAMSEVLVNTPFGLTTVFRLLVFGVILLVLISVFRREYVARTWSALIVLSIAVVTGRSLVSHAASAPSEIYALGIASNAVHLLAASIWIGGLATVVAIGNRLRYEPDVAANGMRRLSLVASISVLVLVLTAVLNGWIESGSFGAILSTQYGRLLIAKTGLFAVVLGFASLSLYRVWRSSSGTGDQMNRNSVMKSVSGELTFAVVILGLSALLSIVQPARVAAASTQKASEAPMAMPITLSSSGETVVFGVTPNFVGANTLLLEATDEFGRPLDLDRSPTIEIFSFSGDVHERTLTMKSSETGVYSLRSKALSFTGTWVARVGITPPGEAETELDFVFRVPNRPKDNRNPIVRAWGFLTGSDQHPGPTGPLVESQSSSAELQRTIRNADSAMNSLETLSECNNINGVVTHLSYQSPNRMSYSVEGGSDSVIIGDSQWYHRAGSGWVSQPRSTDFMFPDFRYSEDAVGIRHEGEISLGDRVKEVVSFYSPRDQAEYHLWIDMESGRISRLLMNAPPTHYMVSVFHRVDEGQTIAAPTEQSSPLDVLTNAEIECDFHDLWQPQP